MATYFDQRAQGGLDGASFGQSATSALSDMHAKWTEHGAREFVPTNMAGNVNYTSSQRHVAQRGMMRGDGFAAPGMGSGMGFVQMGNNWGGAMGGGFMGPEGQWPIPQQMPTNFSHMSDNMVGNLKTPAPPTPAKTYVAVWNLSHDYTSQAITHVLEEIDFQPDQCAEAEKGAFLLTFSQQWQAAALHVSLDGSRDVLNTEDDNLISMATYGVDSEKWSREDVPASILQRLQQKLT